MDSQKKDPNTTNQFPFVKLTVEANDEPATVTKEPMPAPSPIMMSVADSMRLAYLPLALVFWTMAFSLTTADVMFFGWNWGGLLSSIGQGIIVVTLFTSALVRARRNYVAIVTLSALAGKAPVLTVQEQEERKWWWLLVINVGLPLAVSVMMYVKYAMPTQFPLFQ